MYYAKLELPNGSHQAVLFGIPIYSNHLLLRGPSFKSFGSVDTKQPSNSTTLNFILSWRQTRRRRVKQYQIVVSVHNLSPFNLSIPLTIAYLHHTFSTWLVRPQVEVEQQTSTKTASRDKPRNFSCAFPFGTSTGSGSGAQKGSEGCRTGVDVLEVETQI